MCGLAEEEEEQVGEAGGEQHGVLGKPATSSLKLSGLQPAVKLAAASPAGELSQLRWKGG